MQTVKFEKYKEKILKDPSISEENRKLILEYLHFKEAQGLTKSRLNRIFECLKRIVKENSVEFSKLSNDDIKNILIKINNSNLSEWTKYTYLIMFKGFCKWLNKEKSLNLDINIIKPKEPKNSIMPEYLITEEEFNKLFNSTDDLQTRVLLGLLYESGSRIGELLSLKIQNISFNQYGARILVHGKTGQRVIPIIWFSNLLRQYLEIHPLKDNPEAPLWFWEDKNGNIKPIRYEQFRAKIKRLSKKAGIKKRIWFHLFRHSRLTQLAKDLPEQVLKQISGWVPDSRMAKIYMHLSQKDVEEKLLSNVYGIKIENNKEKVKICPKCGEINPYMATICQRCKTPLDSKKLIEMELKEKEFEEWSEVLLDFFKAMEKINPEIFNVLREILKKKGKEHLLKG